ncbi:MAG: beta-glucosidase BglX [Muribaculaceae bacterium]
MKHLTQIRSIIAASLIAAAAISPVANASGSSDAKMNKFIDKLMAKMTLEEKIGQLNLGAGGNPMVINSSMGLEEAVASGFVSACGGADMNLQRIAVEKSRLGIPLLFGLDVIHGYATTFPIPLAQASSWNLDLIERGAQIAAVEATAAGISWTWSPMVDIARDPRWGRVAEGAGEDPYLGSRIAEAMVRGYQGNNLANDTTLMACFKHFALYGAAEGGRDYNTVDMSRWYMYNFYLPPYKAAVEAGCATGMSSFNVVDGIPASANRWLLTDLLRGQWSFDGFIVSDANAVFEITNHRTGDPAEATRAALTAGLDMDMGSRYFLLQIVPSLNAGKLTMADIDTAVRRILVAKYRLGLFDDPYRYLKQQNDPKRKASILSDEHVAFARKLAGESIVLLKNDGNLLPLRQGLKHVAVVGPLGKEASQLFGCWSARPDGSKSHTIVEALQAALGDGCKVTYAEGCKVTEGYGDYYTKSGAEESAEMISAAVAEAEQSDVVIACVGEPGEWSGEVNSRVDISLPPSQKSLLKALKATGKPVVVVLFNGRPLALADEDANFPAIVEAWHGGTQAADALADVLTGAVNPSAKVTMSFPRYKAQVPIHYNHLHTGRPIGEYEPAWFCSKYIDIALDDNSPLYPFGYGLSYNNYEYSNLRVDKSTAKGDADCITVSIDVRNAGTRIGMETVQLYITDLIATTSRPVIELKGFQKLSFEPAETKTVSFVITTDMLKYYNHELSHVWDAGDFDVSIAPNSRDLKTVRIHWDK